MDSEKLPTEIDDKEELVSSFEKLLDLVGSHGKYQWRLILFFMIPFSITNGFAEYNFIILMSNPSHVCHVAGREHTNFTKEEWYNLSIPWQVGPDGLMRHSQCEMYDIFPEILQQGISTNDLNFTLKNNTAVECSQGWDYDDTDWTSTVVSEFNWVCNNKELVTHIYTIRLAGAAIGTSVFSILSDRFGRKPIFIVTLLLNLIFSSLLLICPSFITFGTSMFLMSLAFYAAYQMPFLIINEVCSQHLRNMTILTSFLALVLSSLYISFTAWWTGHWKWFLILCHAPMSVFLLFLKFLPESPRWLLSKGKIIQCEKLMRKISSVNGTIFTEEMEHLIEKARDEEKKKITASKIFTSFVLTKHLLITCGLLTLSFMFSISIAMNVHNMTGNPFVNFFILTLFEIPGHIFGNVCSENLGRRMGSFLCMFLASGFILLASYLVTDIWASTIFCGITKLFVSGGILIIYLQVGEIFPTQLRATAYGITGVVGMTGSIFIPNLMALGSHNVKIPYYIMFIIGLMAAFIASFLPETLGRPLPQTLDEAKQIGKGQSYFSVIHKWNVHQFYKERTTTNASVKLIAKN